MANDTKKHKSIKSKLIKLQTHGSIVIGDLRRSQLGMYLYLSELYLWWREAGKIKGYLPKQYASLGKKFKTVTYGINFSPLLWLAFGNNNLDRSAVDRYSRAMNKIHKEYESRPEQYAKDGVAKLANFVTQSGGIGKLCGYVLPDDDTDTEENDKVNKKSSNEKEQTEKALLELVRMLGIHHEMHFVANANYIKSTPSNFSVLLVQHTKNGFNIIDSDTDTKLVDKLLAQNLRSRFDVSKYAIRPILELLQTQCWPKKLEGIVDRLVDKTRLKDQNNKQFISHRRVLYRQSCNQFILSPMNAYSGVVSIVERHFNFLLDDCKHDVFLPVPQRAQIETDLLRNYEFNLYDVEQETESIPKYTVENSASHVVHLRHRFKQNKTVTLGFMPNYSSVQSPQDQVIIDPDYVLIPNWYALVGHHEIKRIKDNFIDNWLAGFAEHLTRKPHSLIKLTFMPEGLIFDFVYQNNEFERYEMVGLNMLEVSEQSVEAYFTPKDLIPALNCLAVLPITCAVADDPSQHHTEEIEGEIFIEEQADYKGGVWFELNEDLLRIQFCTLTYGGSEHNIYIPTVDLEGNRATKPFMRYHPEVIHDPTTTLFDATETQDDCPLLRLTYEHD